VKTNPLMKVTEALNRILESMPLMSHEEIPITNALGRVTAEDVRSRRTQPPVPLSSMDGYAVRFQDIKKTPSNLKRVGSAPAGGSYSSTLKANETVRIFTGGPIPDGADTVVIQENVNAESENNGAKVVINEKPIKGQFIRLAGLDFKAGDIGIKAGKTLTTRDIGLAAAMNIPWITVRRRPKVAILATGDEIVRPGEEIGPHQIVSSNSYSLAALVQDFGGEPLILGIAPDTIEGIQSSVKGALNADLLLTTGGASVGQHDLIQEALSKKTYGDDGLDVNFWRIAMRPGKPLIFGRLGKTPIIGLPGNPVSTVICSLIFVKPAIEKMIGTEIESQEKTTAYLCEELSENDERQDYLRALVFSNDDGNKTVRAFQRQDSSMMMLLTKANCLIVRPPYDPKRSVGEEVEILKFKGDF
jgi:molybdopterin molybdotransferase